MFQDEKINYTSFLRNKPLETDPSKLATMKGAVCNALKAKGVHGHIRAVYYADGNVKIEVDGIFYGVFNAQENQFFSGCVGDER